jgi:hypothetical protein
MLIPLHWFLTPVELDVVRAHPRPGLRAPVSISRTTIVAALDMNPATATGAQTDYLIRLRDAFKPDRNEHKALDAKYQCFKKVLFQDVG